MFADTEAMRALEAITRQRPGRIVLDRAFATSSRGTALVNRVRADPALASCEFLVVPREQPTVAVPVPRDAVASIEAVPDLRLMEAFADPSRDIGAAATVMTAPSPALIVVATPPVEWRETRRAPRHAVPAGLEVLIDGSPATLVDVSLVGAQVVMPTIVRPNQRVRVSLPNTTRPVRCGATIIWAKFEMPPGGPQYRAGLGFIDADAAAVQLFIDDQGA